MVEKFSGVLKNKGLIKGDRVIIYMPMIIETAVAMLSCARLGLIHSVVFGGFSSRELANRIISCKAKIIVSSSCGLEPHKVVIYSKMIREALELAKDSKIPVIYVDRK